MTKASGSSRAANHAACTWCPPRGSESEYGAAKRCPCKARSDTELCRGHRARNRHDCRTCTRIPSAQRGIQTQSRMRPQGDEMDRDFEEAEGAPLTDHQDDAPR